MKKLILPLVLCVLLVGCGTTQKRISQSSAASELQVQTDLQNSSIERAKESTDRVQENAEKIDTIASKPQPLSSLEQDQIQEKTTEIKRDADLIEQELKTIEESNKLISNTVIPNVVKTEEQLNQTQEDLKNSEDTQKQRDRLYTIMIGIFGIGSLAIVAGIVLAFLNPRLGLMVAGAGLHVNLIEAAGTYFMKELAIVGLVLVGILLVGTLVVIVRSLLVSKTKEQTLESNIEVIEQLKAELPEELHHKYFGDDEHEVDGVFKETLTPKQIEAIQKIRKRKILPVEEGSSEDDHVITANLLQG